MVEIEEILAACIKRKKELGVSYKTVANAAGLEWYTVYDLLHRQHRKNPGLFIVGHVCGALGVSLDEFFHNAVPQNLMKEVNK